jgi:uncharacterized membrane protein YphA (DoxX/SURF4 family)
VSYCTVRGDSYQYSQVMHLLFTNRMYAAAGWALVVCASALAAGMTPRGLAVAGCLALLPALFIARFWNHAAPSMSQSIQNDLR